MITNETNEILYDYIPDKLRSNRPNVTITKDRGSGILSPSLDIVTMVTVKVPCQFDFYLFAHYNYSLMHAI